MGFEILHQKIQNGKWSSAIDILSRSSGEGIRMSSEFYEGNLPLHMAFRVRHGLWPKDVTLDDLVHALLSAYPDSVTIRNHKGSLPLHIAVERGAPADVILGLIHAYPEALKERDSDGLLPRDLYDGPLPDDANEGQYDSDEEEDGTTAAKSQAAATLVSGFTTTTDGHGLMSEDEEDDEVGVEVEVVPPGGSSKQLQQQQQQQQLLVSSGSGGSNNSPKKKKKSRRPFYRQNRNNNINNNDNTIIEYDGVALALSRPLPCWINDSQRSSLQQRRDTQITNLRNDLDEAISVRDRCEYGLQSLEQRFKELNPKIEENIARESARSHLMKERIDCVRADVEKWSNKISERLGGVEEVVRKRSMRNGEDRRVESKMQIRRTELLREISEEFVILGRGCEELKKVGKEIYGRDMKLCAMKGVVTMPSVGRV